MGQFFFSCPDVLSLRQLPKTALGANWFDRLVLRMKIRFIHFFLKYGRCILTVVRNIFHRF